MCFVDLEKASNRDPSKVMEWAMMKRDLPEAMVNVVMSLYKGARKGARVGSQMAEKFKVQVGVHKDVYCCHSFLESWLIWLQRAMRRGIKGEAVLFVSKNFMCAANHTHK